MLSKEFMTDVTNMAGSANLLLLLKSSSAAPPPSINLELSYLEGTSKFPI